MARCQRLGRDLEDSYEGGPSLNRCSGHVAISPIYHISEACCPHRYEIPVANSGRQRFLESCDIQDEFITEFSREEKISLFGAFAASVRQNEFGR